VKDALPCGLLAHCALMIVAGAILLYRTKPLAHRLNIWRAAYYKKFPYLEWMPGWRTANTESNYRKTLIRLRFAGALLLSSGVSIILCIFLILFLVSLHSSHGLLITGGVFLITFANLFRLTFYFSRDTSPWWA
jgi:hypothetical protein